MSGLIYDHPASLPCNNWKHCVDAKQEKPVKMRSFLIVSRAENPLCEPTCVWSP
jgi:hypothetical protein